jgi:hypothetical protein
MCVYALVLGGCATNQSAEDAQGEGTVATYPYAYDTVFEATLAAAQIKGLELVEADKPKGRVLLTHGITWRSWGEQIAVFLKATAPQATQVEIVSKPVLAPLTFAPDWQQILHEQIETELRARKLDDPVSRPAAAAAAPMRRPLSP